MQTHTSRTLPKSPCVLQAPLPHSPAPAALLTILPEVIDSSGHAKASLPQLEGVLTLMGAGTTDHPQFPFQTQPLLENLPPSPSAL